jgi:heme-degrading monooxygenase HmoA
MIVLLFKSQLRADIDLEDYQATRGRMMELVNTVPGFISCKTFRADDGETIAIAKFESAEALEKWRHHPDHVAAQRRDDEDFCESHWIQVCETVRDYGWSRSSGRADAGARRPPGRPPSPRTRPSARPSLTNWSRYWTSLGATITRDA